jgi:hypothetical protein
VVVVCSRKNVNKEKINENIFCVDSTPPLTILKQNIFILDIPTRDIVRMKTPTTFQQEEIINVMCFREGR